MPSSVSLLELLVAELQGHGRLMRYPVRALQLSPAGTVESHGCVIVSPRHTPAAPLLRVTGADAGLTIQIDSAEGALFERLRCQGSGGIEHLASDRIRITDAGGVKRFIGLLWDHRLVGEPDRPQAGV
jgi:hypothetical protein